MGPMQQGTIHPERLPVTVGNDIGNVSLGVTRYSIRYVCVTDTANGPIWMYRWETRMYVVWRGARHARCMSALDDPIFPFRTIKVLSVPRARDEACSYLYRYNL